MSASEPSPMWLVSYLRVVRAPAVFSALADPLAGMLIARGKLSPERAVGVATAAASLYLAGMAFNDFADREEDARDRPERPIPAGEVSSGAAVALGGALTAFGVLAAQRAGAGPAGLAVAGSVLVYDFGLKSGPMGPVAMGACRALSLSMGAEAAGGVLGVDKAAGAALLLGAYVAGLTLLARGETANGGRKHALPGAAMAGAALAGALLRGGRRALPWVAAVTALAAPAVVRAVSTPSPGNTGKAVGTMIRAIPAFDAALAAPHAPGRTAILATPLLALVRWGRFLIPIT